MKSAKKRARELLKKMSVREKVGQLNQHLYGFRIYAKRGDEIEFTEELKAEVKRFGGLGVLYGLYRADPWSKRDYSTGLPGKLSVRAYNQLQKYVMEHSRLGIPVLISSECPHGHQALDGYLLPVNLAVGATFNPCLLEQAGEVCAKQLKSMGVDLALVSALDILRDPRWGRSEECYSEDPYLASEFAGAIVKGIQKMQVGVVAKHFCAQGETTGGINASAARIGNRELREIHLPAAEACCRAGVKGIMAAYNEIDGVYCHANKILLTDILRKEFNFSGMVMADGIAIDQLDIVSGDNVKSAALALNAGVDISLWDEGFTKLEEALGKGLINEERLDEAVVRVLTYKYEQGLFDRPYINEQGERTSQYNQGGVQKFGYDRYRESERLARESSVLLKNNGILPLHKHKKTIALIGPNADDIYRQLGDYSPAVDVSSCYTLKRGMELEFGFDKVFYTKGNCLKEAIELANKCDLIVLALGGSSSRFLGAVFDENGAAKPEDKADMDCGEGIDTAGLELPGNQKELFRAVKNTGKKIITVIIAGRPYAVSEIAEASDALFYSFYPGPMGGKAIAELISGKYSPSGRLPVSLPRCAGQLPVYYNHTVSYGAMRYCDLPAGALYEFGEGMGYSKFSYEKVKVKKCENGWEMTGIACNTGNITDHTVLQCYRKVLSGELVPRRRELKAFLKLEIEPGEAKKFQFFFEHEVFTKYYTGGNPIEKCQLWLMDQGRVIFKTELY